MFKTTRYKKYEIIYTENEMQFITTKDINDIELARSVANGYKKLDGVSDVQILEISIKQKIIK